MVISLVNHSLMLMLLVFIGVTCTDFAADLQAGLAAGDATTVATIDDLFAGVAGMSCTDYGASYVGMCVEGVIDADAMYLMDTSLETWGLFLTYNAASVQQYLAGGYSMEAIATSFPALFANDSGYDFDPSCYATGETCGGRLLMNVEPTCIPEIQARHTIAEFAELSCGEATGDVAGGFDDLNGDGVQDEELESAAGDGTVNVVDVIKIVNHILGNAPLGGELFCAGDLNFDGIINVVDIVHVVNLILSGSNVISSKAATKSSDTREALPEARHEQLFDINPDFESMTFGRLLHGDFYNQNDAISEEDVF